MSAPLDEQEFFGRLGSVPAAQHFCDGLLHGFLHSQPYPLALIQLKANAVVFTNRLADQRVLPPDWAQRLLLVLNDALERRFPHPA